MLFITVTWFEVPDHVKLTDMDHQIKRDAEHRVIYPSHVIEKLWNKYLGSSVQCLIIFTQ